MADNRDGAATTYSLRSLGTGALQASAGNHTHGGGGTGDFVGPAASTDHAVVRFDLATGKLGQNSVLIVSDLGVCTGGVWNGTYTDASLAAIDAGTWTGAASITTLGTISTGTWSATAVAAIYGGTGQTVYVVGDLLYASTTTELSKLAAGTSGYVLTSGGAGVAPTWAAASGGSGLSQAQVLASAAFGSF